MAKAITKLQRLFSIKELSDTLFILIFDIHRINARFVFHWLINVALSNCIVTNLAFK